MARHLGLKLWSTRINSSRQLVGTPGEALNSAAPGTPAFAAGIRGRRSCAIGATGTTLPGKATPVVGSTGQSFILPVDTFGHKSEKLPRRSAAEGTLTLNVCPGTRSLRHS